MANSITHVRLCDNGKGWCVEAWHETYGPLDTEAEAWEYARLLNKVSTARTQIACTDEICCQ